MNHQAFAHIAGENTGRIKALNLGQHLFDQGQGAAEARRQILQIEAQIAALIHAVDQGVGDGALGVRKAQNQQLRRQMVLQRGFADEAALYARIVNIERARFRACARPVNRAAHIGRLAAVGRGRIAHGHVAGRGVVQIVVPGVNFRGGGPRTFQEIKAGFGRGFERRRLDLALALFALQQRIFLQLLLDKGFQLKIRQLQKLDGLLQLRRNDQ